jgi:EmrB/QacA subfamily drug resistance transporter
VTLAIVLSATMMTAIDTTAVILALPTMLSDLGTDIVGGIWIIMAYLLVIATIGTQVGRLGDMFGRVRMYNLGFFVFTAASLFCGLSQTGTEIIAFRVVQGVGGALVFANSGAIIADTFPPHQRGRAYGLTAVGYSTGAILGILLGGALTTFVSWRAIFFLNIPVGLIAGTVGFRVLKERSPLVSHRFDVVGMVLLGGGLSLLLGALTYVAGFGLSSTYELEMGFGGALVVAFLLWEAWGAAQPLLDLKMFRRWSFTASIFAAFFQATGALAVLFVMIMYLQGVRGLSPFNSSLLLVPGYVLGAVVAPFAGRLSDRHGARVVASLGIVAQAIGISIYASLGSASSLVIVVLGSVVSGCGNSAFFPSNNSEVMTSAPPGAYGIASGLLRMFSNIGTVCSFAIALLVVSLSIPRSAAFAIFLGVGGLRSSGASAFLTGMHNVLLTGVLFLAVALVLSVARGKRRAHVGGGGTPTGRPGGTPGPPSSGGGTPPSVAEPGAGSKRITPASVGSG